MIEHEPQTNPQAPGGTAVAGVVVRAAGLPDAAVMAAVIVAVKRICLSAAAIRAVWEWTNDRVDQEYLLAFTAKHHYIEDAFQELEVLGCDRETSFELILREMGMLGDRRHARKGTVRW